jgi:hypothetical protein
MGSPKDQTRLLLDKRRNGGSDPAIEAAEDNIIITEMFATIPRDSMTEPHL